MGDKLEISNALYHEDLMWITFSGNRILTHQCYCILADVGIESFLYKLMQESVTVRCFLPSLQ